VYPIIFYPASLQYTGKKECTSTNTVHAIGNIMDVPMAGKSVPLHTFLPL